MQASGTLAPPSDTPRAASIMTTASSASAADKTGHVWSISVTEENCWNDLILTLGESIHVRSRPANRTFHGYPCAGRDSRSWNTEGS